MPCRVENLTGVPKAFIPAIQQASSLLATKEHSPDCPVFYGASIDCIWPDAVCLPADAPAITRVVNIARKEPYDVYMGRAGKGHDGYFGNPVRQGVVCDFCGSVHTDRLDTIECFEDVFTTRMSTDTEYYRRILSLQGKVLGCFCRPLKCHCNIIAETLMHEAGWRV